MNGGLTFDYPASKSFTAIKPFNTFDISIDPSRLTEIMIEVTAGLDRHSLYSRNAEYGARGFSIEAEMVYNIDMSLSDTEEGIFVVKGGDGLDRDPSKYVISGILMDNFGALIGGSGSFFNLVNVTDLELLDLTIRDASISSDGSVLRMTNANADAVFSNIILENNFSDNRGGAIYAAAGELYIDSVTALGNIGYLGGVLYASDDVKVKFDNATRFTGNSAFSGGVIYAENVTNSITLDNSNVLFDSNNAADFGGVIYSFNSPLSFVDSTIIFSNNTADYGGVIYADSSDIDFTGGNITFSDNISAYGGGAIYATGGESSLSFYETLTRFTDNISGNGGAIAVLGSTMSISVWASDVLFEGNSASKGADIYMENSALNIDIVECNPARVDSVTLKGGIYVETDQNTINKTGSGILTLMGDNYLQGAFNVSGGRFNVENAFYEHENGTFTLSASRGMYISGSTMSFSDTADVIITNNSYDEYASRFDGSYGGALTVSSGSSVTFEGNVDFINNLSYDYGGGAIYNDGSSVYFNSDKNINFSSNKTDPENDPGNYGGAVYNVNDALLSFSGAAAVSFDGNTALAGGAIANLGGSQVVFDGGSVVFARNEAEGFKYGDTPEYLLGGGAVYNDGGSSASFNDISADFSNNTAVSGGAIANNGASTLSFSASTVIFSSNSTNGYHYSDQSLYDWNGGAIHNVGGSAVNFDDTDAVFLVNSAYAGGAVYNDGASKITFTGGKTKFIENSVINESNVSGKQYSGGALYNAGASTAAFIGGDVTFSSNTGRALVNTGGSTAEFDNVNAVFSYNTSAFNGGAVLNEAASVLRLIGDIEFSNNRSSGSGGAIYNSATAYLTADNSDITFSGNRAASSGGAIYNASGAVLNLTTDNGDIVFTDNMIGTGTSRNDIYNIGRINIEGNSGSVIVNGGISGTSAGYIYKSGNNDFYINGNSSGYAGRFIQTGGNTIVTSNYFTGISSITAGVLELSTGTVLSGGTIGIYGAGDMEITTQGNLTFSGNVIGNGTINKPSAGMLTLTGNNSGFTGVYTQTAGTTTVNVTGSMFTGTNNIESSLLNVTHSGASMGYNVNLGNGGISRYYKADASVTALSAGNITFTGDNALAYFGGSSASMVSYLLNGAFANSGSGNEVVFDNAYVSFGSDNFTNDVLYSFNNSTVSISNALTGPGSTRTVTFDDISVSNSKLDFGVTFDAAVVGYDRLVTASSAGSFDLGRLIIKHDMDAGLNFDYRLNVLDGVEFNAGGVSDVATTVYEYEAKVADDDYHDVILKAVRFSDAYSLDRQNMKYNERAFLWSYAGAYHEGNSLHDMSSGTFYVGGYSQDASESLLSGLLYYSTNTATGRGSFFNIEGSTEVDFYLYDLTVSSAQANGDYASDSTIGRTDMDGSVIRVMSDFAVVNVSNVIFDDNEAFNNGGVIYSGAGIMNISSSAFINNKALGDGGALYVTNSTVNLNTDIGDILFAGNTANGADNDIYLGDYADLQITGSGNTIISGGILSDISSSGIEVRKSGSGTVYLGGVNKVYGNFNVDDGTLGFNDNVSYEGTSLSVAAGASLNMHNASADTADVETFNSSGNLTIDIFSAGTNDIINTSSADITGGSLAVMVGSGTYYNDRYYLITATDAVAGKFASSSLSEPLRYRLFYNTNNVWLDVNYFYISSFSALSPLTFNQKQTAKAIDRISHNASAEWGALIDHMMWDLDDNGQRYILAHLSGYFLANVVRNAAADIPSKQIYDKIKNHDEDNITSSGLWAQVRGGHEIWFGDENSLEDYKDSSLGAMVGFDRYLDGKNLMYGIYAGVSKDWIKQDKNEADGTRGSLGIYSGYIKEDWEVKGLLLGSMDTFDTKREVLGAYADGVIDALTISADLEGALKFELTERMLLRPFIGLEAANVNYKSFDEKGAGMYNLNVNGGNYFRSSARVGAGIEYVRHKWGAYASAEARYLITGYKPEVESVFVNTDIEFLSRGTTEGQIEGGINAGVEKKITNNFKVFANANLTAADRYGYIGGNVGLRYVFGRKNALLAKYLERAYQLANSADKDSGKVENFVTLGQYPKAKEYAVTGLNKVDETFGLFDLITSALDSDRNMKVSEKSTAEERLAHIDDIAERAKNRIMSSLYDIKELEEAKGYIDTAEKHLSAADEAKKLDMQDKVVSEGKLAVTAIDEALKKTGEAQEKVNTRAASQEQIVADAKIAIAEADKALQKAGEAQHRLASTAEALSKEDIEFIEKSIERTAEKARKLKNKAEQLIESEENVSKKANERRRNPGAIMIRLHVASFDIDEAVINSEDEKNIKEAADDINKIDFKKITVEGHTDNTGTHEHNVGLSQRRAAVVKDKLIEYGVPAGRISYVGFAETMPIQTNETKEGRAANRRTEIFIE
ncbi:MAG: OmpA family protein [Endomicrobia bacterium]|nr:OmpA family protein [Endomicrobiia bacterium]